MKPHIVGMIFARGGSKGVPRKNIRLLAGKPLIAYAIEAARNVRLIERIVVSTEDPEIAQIGRQWGAEVPFLRPAELAADDSPEWLAWQHAIRALEELSPTRRLDVLVCVPTTSPLRAPEDVEACIRVLLEGSADLVITVTPARRSPYFNMVVIEEGYARLVNRPPAGHVFRRQDAPAVFDITTVAYAARRDYVLQASSPLEGTVKAVIVPESRALDIDSELDLKFAEFLLGQAPTIA
jgi:N-acylneuraminate cytidylyltransferase